MKILLFFFLFFLRKHLLLQGLFVVYFSRLNQDFLFDAFANLSIFPGGSISVIPSFHAIVLDMRFIVDHVSHKEKMFVTNRWKLVFNDVTKLLHSDLAVKRLSMH